MQIPSTSISVTQSAEVRTSVPARQTTTTGAAEFSVANTSSSPKDAVALANPLEKQSTARPEDVDQAIEKINNTVQAFSQKLEFSIDKETDSFVVKVVDKETKEVIRQIPSEELLKIAQALDKLQGLLIKDKA